MPTRNGYPVIFGEVLFDCFPDGSRVLGGAPFNVSWHLQAFGAPPLFISRVGDDGAGREIDSAMESWGMDRSGVQRDPVHATGTVRVAIENGEPRFDIVKGSAWDCIDPRRLPYLPPVALVYHGSLALRSEASRHAFEELCNMVPAPFFVDVNLRDPWWDKPLIERLLRHARWAKVNEAELALLAGPGKVKEAARRLLQGAGLKVVVVTRGARGALALTRSGTVAEVEPVAAVDVVDTVGAGDAFASVVLLGLVCDWPIEPTLKRAQEFASAIVGRRGATVRDRSFYAPFKRAWGL